MASLWNRRAQPQGRRQPTRRRTPERRWSLNLEALEQRTLLTGTWTGLSSLAPDGTGTMLLLSDGTVMMQGPDTNTSNSWYRLAPDASGGYVNGTWSQLASMRVQRLYMGSVVLPDGRVFVVGGEYASDQGFSRSGEIYDPVANAWTDTANFSQTMFGDDPTEVLPDGRVLAGYVVGPQTYIYDPARNTWTQTGTKLDNDQSDEETWVKLPDDSILSYDIFAPGHAQRYLPATGQWVETGPAPTNLSSGSVGDELGPAFLLPDGRVFYIGATGHTAFYTPSTDSWVSGPDVPGGLGADDAPGAELPNGKILFAADTPLFNGPTSVFEFDPTTNTYTNVTPSVPGLDLTNPSFFGRMLVLPTGQVLYTTGGNQLAVYTPDGSAVAAAQPAITGITNNGDGTYALTGTQLNGIDEGACYGDDALMASNYPIIRLTDHDTGQVYYARTSNWSSTSVATGDTPESTQFTPPFGISPTHYDLAVIANGIASDPVDFVSSAGPSVVSSTPNGNVKAAVDTVRFTFNESIVPRTFENIAQSIDSFTGPDGSTIPVTAVTPVRGTRDMQFDVTFDPQTQPGTYTLVIGPTIRDFMRREMDQNENGVAGEIPGDEYTATFAIEGARVSNFVSNGSANNPPSSVRVTFDEPVDESTFTPAQVTSFTDPSGNPIPVNAVTPVAGSNDTQFDISFEPQTAYGNYAMTIGPNILDLYGNPMPVPFTGSFTVIPVYTASPLPFESLNIDGQPGTFRVIQYADDLSVPVDLGSHTFNFYGHVYTGNNQLYASSNGLITFGSANSEFQNTNLTNDPTQPAIAPLWADWIKGSGSDMLEGYFDTANDRLILQWNQIQHYPSTPRGITFQAILYLDTGGRPGDIVFNYVDLDTGDSNRNGQTSTVGVKDAGMQGPNRLLVSFNMTNPLVGSQEAILVSANGGPGPLAAGRSLSSGLTIAGPSSLGAGAATPVEVSGAGSARSASDAQQVAANDQAVSQPEGFPEPVAWVNWKRPPTGVTPGLTSPLMQAPEDNAWLLG